MARKIIATSASQREIRDVGPAQPLVDPATVAQALGAEEAGTSTGMGGSPGSLVQLRAELARRLQSSGGRPSLEGATRRVKIPVTDSQWRELEDLAASLSDQGFSPSAGQVASALLSLALPHAKGETTLIKSELICADSSPTPEH
jgi:hypothetical protein